MRILLIEQHDFQSSTALVELGHEVVLARAWQAIQKQNFEKKWDVVLISVAAWIVDTNDRDRFANLAVALRTASDNAKVVMCPEVVEGPTPGWIIYSDYDLLRDLFPRISRNERLRSDSRRVAFVQGTEGFEPPPEARHFYKKDWIALMACSGLFSTNDFNFPEKYVERYWELLKP